MQGGCIDKLLMRVMEPCCSTDFDLHSQILMGLAEVLADSRSKATASEVDKLVSKCPIVPILDDKEKTIFTRQDKPDLGVMVGTLNDTLTTCLIC